MLNSWKPDESIKSKNIWILCVKSRCPRSLKPKYSPLNPCDTFLTNGFKIRRHMLNARSQSSKVDDFWYRDPQNSKLWRICSLHHFFWRHIDSKYLLKHKGTWKQGILCHFHNQNEKIYIRSNIRIFNIQNFQMKYISKICNIWWNEKIWDIYSSKCTQKSNLEVWDSKLRILRQLELPHEMGGMRGTYWIFRNIVNVEIFRSWCDCLNGWCSS